MIATRFLRFILAVSAITMLVQATFAGRMLAGDVKSAALHAFTAKVLVLLGGSQVLAALVLFLQRRCPLWVPVAALGLVSAEVVEFAAGRLHHVAIHVPLGLAIFGGAIRQLLWAIGGMAPAR